MANRQEEKSFRSSISEEKLAKARKMREDGMFYQEIADSLGVTRSTLQYALNPEARKCKKEYCENNKDKKAEYDKEYHKDNKDRLVQYRKDNRERILECKKEYRKNNKDKIVKYRKEYYGDNKEKIKEYYKNNPEKFSAHVAKRRALIAGTTAGNLDKIAEIYRISAEEPNIQCYICGKLSQIGDRAVDHIFPVSKGYPTMPPNLAITHAKCNREKHDKMPDEIDVHDKTVVTHARKCNNLIIFHNLLNLIISSTEN